MRRELTVDRFSEFFPSVSDEMKRFFKPDTPIHAARAPGRLDVMGGIADYSGSLVLQYPLAVNAVAAVQIVEEKCVSLASFPEETELRRGSEVRTHAFGKDAFLRLCEASYDEARQLLKEMAPSWVAYLMGPVLVLLRECSIAPEWGLRIGLCSNAPEGKGIASSAAVEMAVFAGSAGLLGCQIQGTEAARLCQLAENQIVGAPCGIMDQTVSAVGRRNQLIALLCQPAKVVDFLEVPQGLSLIGIDSGIRHAVSGSDYTSVRVGAFMGLRIISAVAEETANPLADEWNGYLANVGVQAFEDYFERHLPERMSGGAFLEQFGNTADTVTRVEPDKEYAVLQSTAHPIREHERINRFASLLAKAETDEASRIEMGRLMYESHTGYSACGLGSTGTDQLVNAVRKAGPRQGLYGAKITGGGSGGTVAVLARSDAAGEVARIADAYRKQTGHGGQIFQGSSPGAFESE